MIKLNEEMELILILLVIGLFVATYLILTGERTFIQILQHPRLWGGLFALVLSWYLYRRQQSKVEE